MNWKELLSKKVKGIPVVLIVAVLAAAGLYAALKLKPAPEDTTEEDVPSGDTGDSGQPVFLANRDSEDSGDNVSDTGDTNEKWAHRAIEWLAANGTTLSLATSAITKYVNSEDLTFAEGLIRDRAVKQFGLPPEGLSTSKTQGYNGPATRQGNPPTNHTVKGQSDNTFAELARLYYGLGNWDAVNLIRRVNLQAVEPFAKGTVIRIPAWHDPKYFVATSAARDLYSIARKNATTPANVQALNPGMKFPVKVGTRVRVR